MSDYYKKRAAYINSWPDVQPFEAELKYQQRCEAFRKKYGRLPFQPMQMPESDEPVYNRVLTFLIEALEEIPCKPNHAFNYLFTGFDNFTESVYSISNNTIRIKHIYHDITNGSCKQNQNVINTILSELFACFPLGAGKYLFNNLYEFKNNKMNTTNIFKRITEDEHQHVIKDYKNILNAIRDKYDLANAIKEKEEQNKKKKQSTDNEIVKIKAADGQRMMAGQLFQILFSITPVKIKEQKSGKEQTFDIDLAFRVNLLLSGILFSLRNDSFHGSLMVSTKSSKATIELYASDYYCFLAIYVLLMLMLIEKSGIASDEADKNTLYQDLLTNVRANMENYRLLFAE